MILLHGKFQIWHRKTTLKQVSLHYNGVRFGNRIRSRCFGTRIQYSGDFRLDHWFFRSQLQIKKLRHLNNRRHRVRQRWTCTHCFNNGNTGGVKMTNCIYCGQKVSAGGSCSKSPIKTHVVEIPGHCIYCGSRVSAGGSCSKSPHKHHEVDAGPKKCIYCGLTASAGGSCSKSPSLGHVLGR